MSKYASKEEEFTSYLLANSEIFKILYYCVVYAGKYATDELHSAPEMSHLTFLPLEIKDITRTTKPFFCNYNEIKIEYDWQDIAIIGGSAVSAIEILTQKDTENYLRTQTADIDIVWWPKRLHGEDLLPIVAQNAYVYPSISEDGRTILSDNYETFLISNYNTELRKKVKYGITSLSPAIIHLTRTFTKYLDKTLQHFIIGDMDYMKKIYKLCSSYYSVDPATFVITFSVEASCDTKLVTTDPKEITAQKVRALKGSILSGSWNVAVYMEFPTIPLRLKVIDIAIHDECSSQKLDTLIYNRLDPIYVSHEVPDSILDVQIPLSKFSMRIPTIKRLLEQQFLALQNRIRDYWEFKRGDEQKIVTHHRRIQYLIHLLTEALHTGSEPYRAFLIKTLQLDSFPVEYYNRVLKDALIKKDEWIASCPIYDPPVPPCSESLTNPEQIKLCSLQTCKIPITESTQFKKLCDENKVINKELCSLRQILPQVTKVVSKKRTRRALRTRRQ